MPKKKAAAAKPGLALGDMVKLLEAHWRRPVKFTCTHCVREAYDSVVNGTKGYVTDEELIEASGHTLMHK